MHIYLVIIKSLQSLKCNYKYRNDVNSLLTNQTFNKKKWISKKGLYDTGNALYKKQIGKNDDVDKIEFGKYQREQLFTHFS